MQQPAPSPDSPAPKVLVIQVTRPLAWLADGWRDLRYAPGVSLVHGILVAVGGWSIAAISLLWIPLLPGAFSGFVLVAPILATGLYEMSRCRERGKPGDMACALDAWRRGTRPLVWMGLGLAIAGTAWVLVSAVLVALFVTAPITGWEAFIRHVILSQGSNLFPVWMTALAMNPSMPKARTKKSTKVPNFPAFDSFARLAMMNSMKRMNPPTPQVMPNSATWASVIWIPSSMADHSRAGSSLASTVSR